MGCIFQDAPGSLIPGVRIGRQVQRVFKMRQRITWSDAELQARTAFHDVGLKDIDRIWSAFPSELSGGMCQRIMISLALAAPDLRLLIADEPTSSLDTVSAAQIFELLFRVRRERCAVLLVITHDVRIVRRFDWVAVLSEGKLAEFSRSSDFLSEPKSNEGRRLLAAGRSLAGATESNCELDIGESSK